jgi:hypothetical protein
MKSYAFIIITARWYHCQAPNVLFRGLIVALEGGIKKAGRYPMRKDILTVERGFASLSELSETPVVSGEQIPHQATSVATSSGS